MIEESQNSALNTKSSSNKAIDFSKFSQRQQAFIKHYSKLRNGSEAARLSGYSIPSANRIATRLLSDVRIREACNRLMDWEFEDWCIAVKGIFHNEKGWQAQVRSLELYGKAKGWLKEQQITTNFLQIGNDDIEKLRQSLRKVINADSAQLPIKSQAIEIKEDATNASA